MSVRGWEARRLAAQSGSVTLVISTGAPFRMTTRRPWGAAVAPVPLRRPWLAELLAEGYRPECLAGGSGTMIVFDTNAHA